MKIPKIVREYFRPRKIFNEKVSLNLTFLGVILFIIGIVLFLWSDFPDSLSAPIKADKIGQFGDFIGGVVGSLWALAGVILFYKALHLQRREFKLQRAEFRLQRTEFILTRITNIIYKQDGLIKYQLAKKEWKYRGSKKRKKALIKFLNDHDKFGTHVIYKDLPEDLKKLNSAMFNFLQKNEFAEFINVINSSFKLVQGYIEDTKVDETEKLVSVLTEKNQELLYSLLNSTWSLRELYPYLRAAYTVYFFHDQNHIYGGFTKDHIDKIRVQINESWNFIKYVQRDVLRKRMPFAEQNGLVKVFEGKEYFRKV